MLVSTEISPARPNFPELLSALCADKFRLVNETGSKYLLADTMFRPSKTF